VHNNAAYTDTLSHNMIGRLVQWGRTNFVLPHWASRPSPVATRPSGHKKGFFRTCPVRQTCFIIRSV